MGGNDGGGGGGGRKINLESPKTGIRRLAKANQTTV